MIVLRLVVANLRSHRVRCTLTALAVALAVSLVVAVTSGYLSATSASQQYFGAYLANSDIHITRRDARNASFAQAVVRQLAQDPDVKTVSSRLQANLPLIDMHLATAPEVGVALVIGIRRDLDQAVNSISLESGSWFDASGGDVAVLDQVAAERMNVKVGQTFSLPGPHGPRPFKVVGIIHKPTAVASALQSIYVPIEAMQNLLDRPGQINCVDVTLKNVDHIPAFETRWSQKFGAQLRLLSRRDARTQMASRMGRVNYLAYMAGGVAMAAALFIILTALTMGVTERSRTLAMLRAIGAVRRQIGAMVLIEGLYMSALGWLFGSALGLGAVKILAWWIPKSFTAGLVVSWSGIAFAAGVSLLGALAAGILPAYWAMRVSPLEALTPLARPAPKRLALWCSLIALPLLAVDPVITYWPLIRPPSKIIFHFALGLPAQMAGFFLIAPLLVCGVEKAFCSLIAVVLRVRGPLLRQQLSGGIWRSAGTGCALMVGLAVLIVMQIQGNSLLASLPIPEKLPDVVVVSSSGLEWNQEEIVRNVKGIKKDNFMPLAVARPEMPDELMAPMEAQAGPKAAFFVGIDHHKALDMLSLQFRDNDGRIPPLPDQEDALRTQAIKGLDLGRHIIISNQMRQLAGLKIGDALPLLSVHGIEKFTVCGIYSSPIIDAMVTFYEMTEAFDQYTISSVFGTLQDARSEFDVQRLHVFVANLDWGANKDLVKDQLGNDLATNPTTSPANRFLGFTIPSGQSLQNAVRKLGLVIFDTRQVKAAMEEGLRRLLMLFNIIPLAALIVAALGVANTLMASIRSRRWQMGILRSIGMTRGQLVRLVVAEALLLGLVGVILGVACGAEMTFVGRGLGSQLFGFETTLQIPWKIIASGVAVVMVLSLAASLWPAAHLAADQPLALLQAGRAAG